MLKFVHIITPFGWRPVYVGLMHGLREQVGMEEKILGFCVGINLQLVCVRGKHFLFSV